MDSPNIYKAYDEELSHRNLNNSHFSNSNKKLLCYVLVVVIVLGLISIPLIHYSHTKRHSSAPTMTKLSCNVARYNESVQPDFNVSLECALSELSRIVTLPESMAHQVNQSSIRMALRDCGVLFEEALTLVNKTVHVAGGCVEELDWMSVGDLKAWISGGMSDVETCLDGLGEVGSGEEIREEIRQEVAGSKFWMSNCLAILGNYSFLELLKT